MHILLQLTSLGGDDLL